ncbi:hypothetical protein K7432_011674 [Basidiobolus ranarum]|uniref:Chromo domain-containing protein n=1 Tax=Basidiobolus ranarum TaxID=34480 RepID=A0ABR2VTF1_9FUNG
MSDLPRNLYVAKRLKDKRIFRGQVYFLVEWDQDINQCELEDTWEPMENVLGKDLVKETASLFDVLNDEHVHNYNQLDNRTPRSISSSDESSTHIDTPPSYLTENPPTQNSRDACQEYTPSKHYDRSLGLNKSFQDLFSPTSNTPSSRSPDSCELPKFNTPSFLSSFQEPIMSTPRSRYRNLPIFDTPTRLSYSPVTPVRKCLWKPSNNTTNPVASQLYCKEYTNKNSAHNQITSTSRTQHSHGTSSDPFEKYPQNTQPTNNEYVSQSSEEIMDEFYTKLLEEAEAEVQKEAIMDSTNKGSFESQLCEPPSPDWTDHQAFTYSPSPISSKPKRNFKNAFEIQSSSAHPSNTSKSRTTGNTKRHHTMTESAYDLLLATTSEIELLRVDKSKEQKFYQNLIAKSSLISNIELKNELIDFVEFKDSESQWPINDWRILPQSELWLFKVSEVQREASETQKCVCLVLNVPKRKITSILLPSWLMQQDHPQRSNSTPKCDDGCDAGSHLCQLQCCHGNPLSIENLSRFIESQVNFSCKNLSSPSIQEIIDSAEKISETLSFLYNHSPSRSNTLIQEDPSIILETQQFSRTSTSLERLESSTPIRSLTPELVDVGEDSEISLSFEGPLYFSIEQCDSATNHDLFTQEDKDTSKNYQEKSKECPSRLSEPVGSPSFLAGPISSPATLGYRAELDDFQQQQFRSPADLSTCRTRKSPTNSNHSDRPSSAFNGFGSTRSQRNSMNPKPSQNISLSLDLISQDTSQSQLLSLDFMDFQVLQRADLYRAYTKLKRENQKIKGKTCEPGIAHK